MPTSAEPAPPPAVGARAVGGWLPSQCEVCRRWTRARLCAECRARHAAACPRCARCGLRTGTAMAACGDCLRTPPPWAQTCCAVDYAFPWVQLLQAFKYQGRDELARPLAWLLADAVLDGPVGLPELLLPVPLSAPRLRERGYNQAWELARHLGRRLHRPAQAQVLLRMRQGPAQAELSRAQRLRNLRQAFQVSPAAAPGLQGRHLALVDDVMTTGATAHAACEALLAAGAARVDVWVLARTPAPLRTPAA